METLEARLVERQLGRKLTDGECHLVKVTRTGPRMPPLQ